MFVVQKTNDMFTNLLQLQKHFKDERVCIEFIEKQRWNGKPECPHCGSEHHYRTSTRLKSEELKGYKDFWCKGCNKKYTTLTGTIYHSSKCSLQIWLSAIYLITAHKKGISSIQLAKDLGVTQKTGWYLNHRIREMLKEKAPKALVGTVEVDETYSGRKFGSEFKGYTEEQIAKMKIESPATFAKKSKGVVMALKQRNGDIRVQVFSELDGITAKQYIKDNVEAGANLYSDQSSLYRTGLEEYKHETVRHTRPNPEFARGDVHVNNIESFWATLKRGRYGIYHWFSFKHLQAYCNEFAYRANTKHINDVTRFNLAVARCGNARLTYPQLIAKTS